MKALRGIVPILPTPFDKDDAVDCASLQRVADHLIAQGVNGLGTLALASEGYKLGESESCSIIRAIVEAVAGRVPVVAATSHEGTRLAVEKSRKAVQLGVDAVMLLPPYFVKLTPASLLEHFATVAQAVQAPVIIQDSPQLTGVAMPQQFLAELVYRAPNIGYVKIESLPAGRSIAAAVETLGPSFGVFCGWGGVALLDPLRHGACGCMPGADLAPALVRVYQAFQTHQYEQAQHLYGQILPLLGFASQSLDRFVIVAKTVLARQGLFATPALRAPFTPLDEIERAEMERLISQVEWP